MRKLRREFAVGTAFLVTLTTSPSPGQTFTKITDADNPIVTDSGPAGYAGASWIDYNNDGRLDLFIGLNRLYRNDGDGIFAKLETDIGSGMTAGLGIGNSWADYDNDGDLDVFIASTTSGFFRNDGGGTFTKIDSGEIGDGFANRGWSCAWGDYNNDGFVDLAITHPAGFIPPNNNPSNNQLLLSGGAPNFAFTRNTTEPIVSGRRTAYTVGTWSDYDQDGDMDYFIGAGPANGGTQADFLFRNQLIETDSLHFTRITDAPLGTDRQDGQIWNWIDYDNDGDLDAYLTNWGGATGQSGRANRLYRNDDGTYTEVTGQAIADDINISLSSAWGDLDNDGDLDCYVANDSRQRDKYYRNNGDGTFTGVTDAGITEAATHRGASLGDFDNDGDLDLVAIGPGSGVDFYRNDTDNDNNWVNILCVGTVSNAAGIGARVRARATIGGTAIWQMREVLAQNTFNGQNSLRVHFGLGDASTIDSLVIEWPMGLVEVHENLAANNFYCAIEGESFAADPLTSVADPVHSVPDDFALLPNYPNPFNPATTLRYNLAQAGEVQLSIYNTLGVTVRKLVRAKQQAGNHTVVWDGRDDTGLAIASGVYLSVLHTNARKYSRKMILLK